jgi:hypothetical protein
MLCAHGPPLCSPHGLVPGAADDVLAVHCHSHAVDLRSKDKKRREIKGP